MRVSIYDVVNLRLCTQPVGNCSVLFLESMKTRNLFFSSSIHASMGVFRERERDEPVYFFLFGKFALNDVFYGL